MSSQVSVTLVGLPIGNILDLSPRARDALEKAQIIFCEDTRKLDELSERAQFSIRARKIAIPGGSEFELDWDEFYKKSVPGEQWALVSDAGTPVLNDPGKSLAEFCMRRGIELHAIPGPCAPILALQWSGGFGLPFVFAGFVPKAEGAQSAALKAFFTQMPPHGTFSFFDTKHQVLSTLEFLIAQGLGEQKIYTGREMTKKHEELLSGTVSQTYTELKKRIEKDKGLGELTFLIESREWNKEAQHKWSLEDFVQLRNLPPKAAAKLASKFLDIPSSECYDAFIKGKAQNEG